MADLMAPEFPETPKRRTRRKLTSADRIRFRLETGRYLDGWRRKVHDLRAIVAGDYSRIDEQSTPQINQHVPPDHQRKNLADLYDILQKDFEEGTSNKMLQSIKTLVMQTSFRFPSIEFDDVEPLEADIMALYVRARCGPRPRGCEAVHHMRLALIDYVIGGLGWVWCGVQDGKPTIMNVDSLDVQWDIGARVITDIRWVAVRWREPLAYWVDMFGRAPFREHLQQAVDSPSVLERNIELVFYFDVEGPQGTYAVFQTQSGMVAGEPIEHDINPHTINVDGLSSPFLPLEPMYFMLLPSVRDPIGIAEMMLPAQIATRMAERYMRSITKRGAPWIDIEEGAYDESELDALESGEPGAIITRKSGKTPAQVREPMEIPSSVFAWYQHNDQELVAHSGANPYASGNKVEGIKYASEVAAIQGSAGLTASTLASDHGAHYERVIRKFLANAIQYDDMPIHLLYDGTTLAFGPEDPIGPYLRPDATPKVSEDSLQFEPRERKLARASLLLDKALQVSAIAPMSARLQYEEFLRAAGVKNVQAHLEMPAMPGPLGTASPTEGGADEPDGLVSPSGPMTMAGPAVPNASSAPISPASSSATDTVSA